jgi:threonine dehydrogenase-like Zn-dependent dehydrogenase
MRQRRGDPADKRVNVTIGEYIEAMAGRSLFSPKTLGSYAQALRKIALVGEGETLGLSPSRDMIHDQKTVYGSWVTSIWLMEDLVERIVRWRIHPEDLVTNRFPLEKAGEAYALMASGKSGKVAVVFDEESQ